MPIIIQETVAFSDELFKDTVEFDCREVTANEPSSRCEGKIVAIHAPKGGRVSAYVQLRYPSSLTGKIVWVHLDHLRVR